MTKKLQYKDKEGNIGEGQSLTDLERNNRLLERLSLILMVFVFFFAVIIGITIWIIHYVIKHNVVNNYIAHCV